MTNKKSLKRALILNVLSTLLCISMLLGTTFAWFTDTVESGVNQIVAGNLDVELYHTNKTVTNEKVTSAVKLFTNVEKWEPGAVAYEVLTVKNEGDLALKYVLSLVAANATASPLDADKTLADVLKVAFVEGTADTSSREILIAAAGNQFDDLASASKAGNLEASGVATYTVIIYWEPGDNDNLFNMNNNNKGTVLTVDLGVTLAATQNTVESDSFNDQYDSSAVMPVISTGSVTMTSAPSSSDALAINTNGDIISASVSGVAANVYYTDKATGTNNEVTLNLNVEKTNETTTSTGTTVSLDIDMSAVITVDNTTTTEKVSELIDYVTVNYNLGTGKTVTGVTHSGDPMEELASADASVSAAYANVGGYFYDAITGILTIKTKSFSPFAVTYSVPVSGISLDQAKDVEMGTTSQLIATVSPANATDKTVTWTSDKETVATVDENGNVTGVFPGTATITAEAGDYSDTCTVTVFKEYKSAKIGNYVPDTVFCSTGSAFLPTVAVNPTVNKYSYTENGTAITNYVHFRFNQVEKQIIDENTYKVIVDLAIKDNDGNDLELKPGNYNTFIPANGFEYLKVFMNTIDATGYSVASVTVNGTALTATTNSSGNPAPGEYWIGYDPKDVYLSATTAGLIEITYTKAN